MKMMIEKKRPCEKPRSQYGLPVQAFLNAGAISFASSLSRSTATSCRSLPIDIDEILNSQPKEA